MSCKHCGAKSHNSNNCPKVEKEPKEGEGGGRGLTQGSKADQAALEQCLTKLDLEALYDDGAKSLVGGRKGKPSGLDDKSYRIDRQGLGNVQFQRGNISLAKVTFGPTVKPGTIIHGLRSSLLTGEEIDL